jgi:hypothetical protein
MTNAAAWPSWLGFLFVIACFSCGDDSNDAADDAVTDAGGSPRDGGPPAEERDAALTPPPAAPSDLEASIVAGGAHLTWQDNSDDEQRFMIERKEDDEPFELRATPMPDQTVFHDGGLVAGVEYAYRIMAVGANNNRSDYSNVVSIALP